MNYFLNNYRYIVYLFTAIIFALLVFPISFIINIWVEDHFKVSEKWETPITFIFIIGSVLLYIYLMANSVDFLNDSEISYVFIQEKDNETRLVAWFTRVDHPAGISTAYSHRLKSYNINNGRQVGRQNLLRRSWINDYSIYGPFDNKAWGYSHKSGVQLLDLYEPKILYTNKEILARNPQLGAKINIYEGSYYSVYEPGSHGIYVVSANGKIYRITPDLKAVFAEDIAIETIKEDKDYSRKWLIRDIKDTDAKFVHAEGARLSSDSKAFISPKKVEYLDAFSQKNDKIWIMHLSSNETDADCLISYINENGQEIKCINLREIFKNKKAKPYFALIRDNEVYIYITCSYYTLTALRTDIKKGDITGRINYFK